MYLFLTTKNSLFTSDIHYFWNAIDFERVILLKFILFSRNSLPKKLESRIFTKLIGLSDFNQSFLKWLLNQTIFWVKLMMFYNKMKIKLNHVSRIRLLQFKFSYTHTASRNNVTQWLTTMLIGIEHISISFLCKYLVPWKTSYPDIFNLSLFLLCIFKDTIIVFAIFLKNFFSLW